MNTPLFFLTTISLGAIAGIAGNHFFEVKEMVRVHRQELKGEDSLTSFNTTLVDTRVSPVEVSELTLNTEVVPELGSVNNVAGEAPPIASEHTKSIQREDALFEILTAVRADQKALQQQLAETNRDLAEANFRLDTHSDSFKPLRTKSDRPYELTTREEQQDDFRLLPPK